jgi:AcrR family transcriptional regulator
LEHVTETTSQTTVSDKKTTGRKHPRDRILDAALDLFFRQGFRGTAVREITNACGLTPGALYNHFSSKEEVLFALISKSSDEGEQALLHELTLAEPDPASQLRALVRAASMYHSHNRAAGVVGIFEYQELPEDKRQLVVARRVKFRSLFVDVLQDGVEEGFFKVPWRNGQQDLKVVATAIVNIAIRITDVFGPTPSWTAEDLADYQADLALQMVRAGS